MSDAVVAKARFVLKNYTISTNSSQFIAAKTTWSRKDCGRNCMAHCAVEGAESQT